MSTENGHQLHCTGIICAKDNQTGMVGVAPEAKCISVKALAKNGSGCNKLMEYLAKKMPPHSFFYDENTISDLPQSILASEITREKLFKNLNQELPYNLTVETEKWVINTDESINIQQTIYINKQSYRPIILGKQGQNIKRIGTLARKELENLLKNKTSKTLIIISHRLSSISGVDNIVVMENGRIIQQGKHNSLMQESGLYREMWEKQKKYQNRDKRDVF